MSEEKMYAVRNDDGEYWDFDYAGFWRRELPGCYAVTSKKRAEIVADERGGHVVTLIEEPEKVVLTKEQAEIVERAHDMEYPSVFIFNSPEKDEELLMKAYVNGYTVAKEKKYYVKVFKGDGGYLNINSSIRDKIIISNVAQIASYKAQFTRAEIEQLKKRDDIPLDWDKVKLEEVKE